MLVDKFFHNYLDWHIGPSFNTNGCGSDGRKNGGSSTDSAKIDATVKVTGLFDSTMVETARVFAA